MTPEIRALAQSLLSCNRDEYELRAQIGAQLAELILARAEDSASEAPRFCLGCGAPARAPHGIGCKYAHAVMCRCMNVGNQCPYIHFEQTLTPRQNLKASPERRET